MDRKGIFIITTCVVIIFAWQFYLGPKHFPPKPQTPSPEEQPEPGPEIKPQSFSESPPVKPVEPTVPQETPKPPSPADSFQASQSDKETKEVVLENDLCRLIFSSRGGTLKQVEMKKFKDYEGGDLTLIKPFNENTLPFGIELLEPEVDLRMANYSLVKQGNAAILRLDLQNGLRVEKIFRLTPEKYDCSFELKLSNMSDTSKNFTVKLHGPGSIVVEDELQKSYHLTGALSYLKNGKKDEKSTNSRKPWQVPKELPLGGAVSTSDFSMVYAGVRNRFFGSALLSKKELLIAGIGTELIKETEGPEKDSTLSLSSYIVMAPLVLPAGKTEEFSFTLFTGPKMAEVLAEYGPLSNLLDYGFFWWVSKPLLLVLRFFYMVTRNYGVAIIFMTLVVKAMLFPLARKGAASQAKQQKLAPRIKEIQTRLKNNKQKLHEELTKLYREEGVSPLGGCLPMLLQIPVFIGLLRLLQYSIELRQAPFIAGWITDLSRPDTIANIPIQFIFQGRLNILPFLMAAATILHQRMMPKPADPQQQQQMKMFKLMPIMFVVILYNWPSGLLLYWTTSSFFSVLEQVFLKKGLQENT